MNFYISHFRKLDWWLIGASCLLVVFGLAAVWSTSVAKSDFFNFQKQIAFFAAGFFLMLAISFFDYRILRNNSYLVLVIYFIAVALLAGVLFFGVQVRGSVRWYKLGFLTLDPLELTKIALIILLAKYFSLRHTEMYKVGHIIFSGFYVLLPAVLVFLRPDLGGALLLVLIWLGILAVSGIKLKHFLILSLCFVLLASFAWFFLMKDYQKDRVISFLFPTDVLGSSWSQAQTKISIGSGQIFGQGLAQGSQVQYGFLPEPHTDFIFSVIAHEWGLVGVILLFALYAVLIWRVVKLAVRANFNFPRLFAVGFAVVLIGQFLINVGMNLSLLPVVGIYLPFVSYGGSGLIASFISLGILQSIKVRMGV